MSLDLNSGQTETKSDFYTAFPICESLLCLCVLLPFSNLQFQLLVLL